MNNEIILQSLTEAFEIIKDSWDTKKEAIINCIVETEKCKINVCQNPYEGYLEKYVYKEEERIKINYHCPNDFSIIKVVTL